MKLNTLSLLLGSASCVTLSVDTDPLAAGAYWWAVWAGEQVDNVTPEEVDVFETAATRATARLAIEA